MYALVDKQRRIWLNETVALTKQEIDALIKLIRVEVDEALDRALEEKLRKHLQHLPSKDEFYRSMDKIMKELETMRQEFAATPSRTEFTELEEKVDALGQKFAAA